MNHLLYHMRTNLSSLIAATTLLHQRVAGPDQVLAITVLHSIRPTLVHEDPFLMPLSQLLVRCRREV